MPLPEELTSAMPLGDSTECSALEISSSVVFCHIDCTQMPAGHSQTGKEQHINPKSAVSAVDDDWKSFGSLYANK